MVYWRLHIVKVVFSESLLTFRNMQVSYENALLLDNQKLNIPMLSCLICVSFILMRYPQALGWDTSNLNPTVSLWEDNNWTKHTIYREWRSKTIQKNRIHLPFETKSECFLLHPTKFFVSMLIQSNVAHVRLDETWEMWSIALCPPVRALSMSASDKMCLWMRQGAV